MVKFNLEIQRVTIELNKALKDLEEDGKGFKDIAKIINVFSLNKRLTELIKQSEKK